jgi:hypothetical protein
MRARVSFLAVCSCLVSVLALAAGAAELAGKWSGDGFVLELRADGGGTIADSAFSPPEPMRWKVQGAELVLTQDDEPVRYGFRLQGQSLRLTGGDLDEPVTLTRSGAAPAAKTETKGKKPAGEKPAQAARAGSCEAACRHFLKCANAVDPQLQTACVVSCAVQGYDAAFLGWFQGLDCPSAVAVIALLDAQSRGLQQGGGGQAGGQGGGRSKDCEGCVWDGSECAWYSQGNWGSNVAYSGAVISCDRSCCR